MCFKLMIIFKLIISLISVHAIRKRETVADVANNIFSGSPKKAKNIKLDKHSNAINSVATGIFQGHVHSLDDEKLVNDQKSDLLTEGEWD